MSSLLILFFARSDRAYNIKEVGGLLKRLGLVVLLEIKVP